MFDGWPVANPWEPLTTMRLYLLRSLHPLPRVVALLLAWGVAACNSWSGSQKEATATLVFFSDLWGQLEPCGCSADMKGGLDRVAGYVESLRREGPVLVVDTGDALFDQSAYTEEEEVQARIRARAISKVLMGLGLRAKVLEDRDRVLTSEGGWFPGEVVMDRPSLYQVGGISVGLIPMGGEPSAERASQEATRLRERGAEVVIALAHMQRRAASSLKVEGVDLVVGSHIETIPEGDTPMEIQESVPILYPAARGQGILQVELVRKKKGGAFRIAESEESKLQEIASLEERIQGYLQRIDDLPEGADPAPFVGKVEELKERIVELQTRKDDAGDENRIAHRFVSITQDLPRDPKAQAILRSYDQEVGEANLAYAKANPRTCPSPSEGEATFVGQATCASCHVEAQAFWETTAHGAAFATLVKANKQYDLSCISCHVTGWERPGGPCSVGDVEGRQDVGCESCHGPGSQHVAAPSKANIQTRVSETTCKSCHTSDHSTGFDYATYLERILGPGHGAASTK